MTRIAVVGAGSIGGWVAARLALAGHGVSILARPGRADQYANGLTLVESGERQTAAVRASDSAADLGPQDIVIFATKAFALADAAEAAQALIASGTVIIPMINGVPWWFDDQQLDSVDPGGRIAAALPFDQVIGNVVHASLRRDAPAEVHVQKVDHLIFGEPRGGDSERVAATTALFEAAGIPSRANADVRRAIWYKAWGNMTMNPMSALTLATADRIIAECRDLKAAAMEEAKAIGAAIGCDIEESAADRIAVAEKLGAFKTSMLQDVEAGRRLELGAIIAAPIELARRYGIATPNLDAIDALTRLMAESRGLA